MIQVAAYPDRRPAGVRDFRKMVVWRVAQGLAVEAYRATRSFPPEERLGLTSQVRRSAFSVSANIAEGCGRGSDGELRRFLAIARGSLCEFESGILLARELGYLPRTRLHGLLTRSRAVERMLERLRLRIRTQR